MTASKHDVIEDQSWVQDTNLINKAVFVSSELCNGGILFSFHNSVPQRYLPKMQHELDQLQLTFTNTETRNQGSLNWYLNSPDLIHSLELHTQQQQTQKAGDQDTHSLSNTYSPFVFKTVTWCYNWARNNRHTCFVFQVNNDWRSAVIFRTNFTYNEIHDFPIINQLIHRQLSLNMTADTATVSGSLKDSEPANLFQEPRGT